jgi:uncharacterized membrane protein
MSTASINTNGYRSVLLKLCLTLVGGISIYYVLSRAFPMLIVSEDNYGSYFYWRASWLFPHIVLGIVAISIGPFQFVQSIRDKYLKFHRTLGKIYLLSILFSGLSGMYLAFTSSVNLAYAAGLFFLSVTWIFSSLMAYLSIRRKKVELHKEWMIRSYTITLAFVSFRLFKDLIMSFELTNNEIANTLMSWACWSVPLFFVEIYLQAKKL